MDPLIIALIVAVFTLLVLFSGIPIAFGLSFVSIVLLVSFEGFQMLDVFAETFFAGLNSFVLLSIPMFILMCIGARFHVGRNVCNLGTYP